MLISTAKQFHSGFLVAALLAASGLLWAVLFFGPLAHLERLASGLTPFDIRPRGYSYEVDLQLPRHACSPSRQGMSSIDHYSNCPHMKRPEFVAARFPESAKNVDGVLVDHLAQLKKRLVWLQIHIGNLLSDLLGTGEDSR